VARDDEFSVECCEVGVCNEDLFTEAKVGGRVNSLNDRSGTAIRGDGGGPGGCWTGGHGWGGWAGGGQGDGSGDGDGWRGRLGKILCGAVAADDGCELLLEEFAVGICGGLWGGKGKVETGVVVDEAQLETDMRCAILAAEEGLGKVSGDLRGVVDVRTGGAVVWNDEGGGWLAVLRPFELGLGQFEDASRLFVRRTSQRRHALRNPRSLKFEWKESLLSFCRRCPRRRHGSPARRF